MTACCCASPDCRVNGCSVQRGLQAPTSCNQPPMQTFTLPMNVPLAAPLTAEDVRRIVREELLRAFPELGVMKAGG